MPRRNARKSGSTSTPPIAWTNSFTRPWLRKAAFYLRPEPLRHPLIFYLGHTATFYINKLIVAKITNQRINPRFESMFAVGVDEMSWDDLNAANYDWPTLAEVKAYRDTVRAVVDETIRTMPLTMPIDWDHPFWVILMGIEHERIHLETSSVIIRRLPIELVRQLPLWSICPLAGEAPAERTGAGRRRPRRAGQVQGPPAVRLGQRIRPAGKRGLGLRRQPISGLQPGIPGLRRRPRLRTGAVLDARGLEMGGLLEGQASAVLDRFAGRLPLPDDGPDHRHALGLARRGELSGSQGFLQLAREQERKTHPAAHRGRMVPAAGPARHSGPAVLAESAGQHQSGALGFVLPGEPFSLRRILRHHWQRVAVDRNADHGL